MSQASSTIATLTVNAQAAKNAARQARRRARRAEAKATAPSFMSLAPSTVCPPHNHWDPTTNCPDCQHQNKVYDTQETIEAALNAKLITEAEALQLSELSPTDSSITDLAHKLLAHEASFAFEAANQY